ncbi:HlyD family secretion protein [uncultured Bacteroides sp.]|uniref:HlyD family secretion protein n=1 Tax=uncultured Bacteroides sp. TaxID=162156 RepID=UPI002AA7BB46|nr:HlyD family secretion protein [uncultured Bacteroides sp.]
MKKENGKKGIKAYIPLIVVIIIVLGGGWYWYHEYTKYVSTDDAHIDSDNYAVSSKILGRINHIYFEEGDTVKEGALLAELDSTELHAQKLQAMASLEQSKAAQLQSEAKLAYDEESIKVLEVGLAKAQEDYARAKEQYKGDVIAKEQYDHLQKAWEIAKAQLNAAKTQLQVSHAQVGSSMAAIATTEAQIKVISTQLSNTHLHAPINGVVAKKWLLDGDVTQPGQTVLTITNTHKLWVEVYLEETKMAGLHLGQKAKLEIDAYPDVTFTGRITQLSSNTASQFSLIPPNNAAGNFTKVTQRVPLKISIDGTEENSPLSKYNLLAGMSVVVKIIKD